MWWSSASTCDSRAGRKGRCSGPVAPRPACRAGTGGRSALSARRAAIGAPSIQAAWCGRRWSATLRRRLVDRGQPDHLGAVGPPDVATGDGLTTLNLGDPPARVPEPLAGLLLRYLQQRPNMTTATNPDSLWLSRAAVRASRCAPPACAGSSTGSASRPAREDRGHPPTRPADAPDGRRPGPGPPPGQHHQDRRPSRIPMERTRRGRPLQTDTRPPGRPFRPGCSDHLNSGSYRYQGPLRVESVNADDRS